MNTFFAKEYTIVRNNDNYDRYPELIKWCKDNIGIRGHLWNWRKSWTQPPTLESKQTIVFIFERSEDHMQFILSNIK